MIYLLLNMTGPSGLIWLHSSCYSDIVTIYYHFIIIIIIMITISSAITNTTTKRWMKNQTGNRSKKWNGRVMSHVMSCYLLFVLDSKKWPACCASIVLGLFGSFPFISAFGKFPPYFPGDRPLRARFRRWTNTKSNSVNSVWQEEIEERGARTIIFLWLIYSAPPEDRSGEGESGPAVAEHNTAEVEADSCL